MHTLNLTNRSRRTALRASPTERELTNALLSGASAGQQVVRADQSSLDTHASVLLEEARPLNSRSVRCRSEERSFMNRIIVAVVAFTTIQPGCWWQHEHRSHEQICEEEETRLENAASELERFYFLDEVAKCVFDDGDFELAQRLANEALDLARRYPEDWNYGNAIHDANVVLGRIALREGNSEVAIEHLRLAGETPGSPQLNSFGPNMTLTRDLLQQGEWDPVYDYLEQCRAFWELGGKKIDRWQALVSSRQIPDFGANIYY